MNALLPDILEIEQLDFVTEIPCEHSQHPNGEVGHAGPAYYLIRYDSPCDCPPPSDYFYICKGGYDFPGLVGCRRCGQVFEREQIWHIVGKVGS